MLIPPTGASTFWKVLLRSRQDCTGITQITSWSAVRRHARVTVSRVSRQDHVESKTCTRVADFSRAANGGFGSNLAASFPEAGMTAYGAQQAFSRGGARVSNAPIPAVRRTTIGRLKSTLTGRAGLLQRAFASARKRPFGFARRAADAHRRLACRAEAAAATAAGGAYLQHR
jgi:hypothetical protein